MRSSELGAEPAVDAVVGGRDARAERMRDTGVLVLLRRVLRQRQRRPLADARTQFFWTEECLRRREYRPLDVAVQLLVTLFDERPRPLERIERAVDDDEQRVGAQVIEQRRRRLEEQRQVVLDAGG